jgi:radical SAM superfamily enzyme YgiQ (UPF0313 family)
MQPAPVLFVSAGLLRPKKRDHALARRQQYLNYGALTLATELSRSGQPARLFHGGHGSPEEMIRRLEEKGFLPSLHPVMLSMPSFYALAWSQKFATVLRARHPDSRLIVGGRWVTSPDPVWLHRLIPEAYQIVPGLADGRIRRLVDASAAEAVHPELPEGGLDHTLVDGFATYQPSIETSRGCGMGCAFCEERDIRLSRLRDPNDLADLLAQTQAQYSGGAIHPYMQSSFFLPNPRWAERLAIAVQSRGLRIRWRCDAKRLELEWPG